MKLGLLLLALGAAVTQPLRIEQGATWSKAFDTDRDLTGCTLGMEIRASSAGTLLAAPTLTITSESAGTFTASLTADQTGQLAFRSAVYDVEATCSATVYRLFEGSVTLSLGVTTDEVAPGEFPEPGTPPGSIYLSIADAADTYLTQADASGYLQSVKTYDDTAPQTLLAWTPSSDHGVSPHSAFQLLLGGSVFSDSQRDHVVGFGWNAQQMGGQRFWYFGLEDHYRTAPGGPDWTEYYLQYQSDDGLTNFRPIYAQVDVDTHTGSVQLTGAGSAGNVLLSAGANQILNITETGTQVYGGRALTWVGTGAKNLLYAQDNAGSTTVLMLEHDQFDRIGVGPNKVILVGGTNSATTLAFFGQTLRTKRTVSGSCYGNPACTSLMTALGDNGYGLITDSTTAGTTTATQVVSAAPSMPTCDSSARGQFAYVDDTNDGAVSRLCFCGTAADDSTYGWRRADAPASACP